MGLQMKWQGMTSSNNATQPVQTAAEFIASLKILAFTASWNRNTVEVNTILY